MTTRHAVFASILLLACGGASAMAGEDWYEGDDGHRHAIHHAIYELENDIAVLEADPETGEGFKAPIISRERAQVSRLRAALPRPQWRWTSPCCYGRPPIYIR